MACAQSRADSLLQIIQETPATGTFADTALSRMYIRLAAIQAREGVYDSSFVRTERAIELLTELEKLTHAPVGVGQQLIMAYKQQGRLHLFESRYDQSLKCMQQAHSIAEELKDTLEIGATLLQMAHAFREMNDTAQALGYNRKAISLLSLIPLNRELALGLMSMGGTYTNVDVYDSAAYYLRRAWPFIFIWTFHPRSPQHISISPNFTTEQAIPTVRILICRQQLPLLMQWDLLVDYGIMAC